MFFLLILPGIICVFLCGVVVAFCVGSSSSPSSSDDEIKEAFETPSISGHHHHWNLTPPVYSQMRAWAQMPPVTAGLVPSEQQQHQELSSWNIETCTSRPLKMVPVSHHKHKFFAQMSTKYSSERPFLDFNKMQHSKRLVMVRNNSTYLCNVCDRSLVKVTGCFEVSVTIHTPLATYVHTYTYKLHWIDPRLNSDGKNTLKKQSHISAKTCLD